jgi:hypothetical protein
VAFPLTPTMADPTLLELSNTFISASSAAPGSSSLSSIDRSAREIANQLRTKSQECKYTFRMLHSVRLTRSCALRLDDNQTELGKTKLPAALTVALKSFLDSQSTPQPDTLSAIYEILRVAANLCMDHGKSYSLRPIARPWRDGAM